jgi:hypothetical protein
LALTGFIFLSLLAGPYWLYLFVSAGDRLQLAEVFCSFTFPLLGQRLFYGKLFTPT